MGFIIFILSSVFLLGIQVILGLDSTKDLFTKIIGSTFVRYFYRLLHIAFSLIIYGVLLSQFVKLDPVVLLDIRDSVPNIVFLIIDTLRLLALFFIIEALWELELFEFLGLKQIWHMILRKPADSFKKNRIRHDEFIPRGLYLRNRQPVFFYVILFFLLDKTISLNNLVFLLVFIPYYQISSSLQEKRLEMDYGKSYQAYKKSVNKFLPMWARYKIDESPK